MFLLYSGCLIGFCLVSLRIGVPAQRLAGASSARQVRKVLRAILWFVHITMICGTSGFSLYLLFCLCLICLFILRAMLVLHVLELELPNLRPELHLGVRQYARYVTVVTASGYASGMHRV